MLYLDTSFLAPPILQEATSAKIEAFLSRQPPGTLTISHWTRVEFSPLLAREARMGGLDRKTALDADAQFEAVVAESLTVWLQNGGDFDSRSSTSATTRPVCGPVMRSIGRSRCGTGSMRSAASTRRC